MSTKISVSLDVFDRFKNLIEDLNYKVKNTYESITRNYEETLCELEERLDDIRNNGNSEIDIQYLEYDLEQCKRNLISKYEDFKTDYSSFEKLSLSNESNGIDILEDYKMALKKYLIYEIGNDKSSQYLIQSNNTEKLFNDIDELLISPKTLAKATPKEWYKYLIYSGYKPIPLGRGDFKGISLENGGGFRVHWGNDRILQYHPSSMRNRHNGAYWKISSGTTGVNRYDLQGNTI